MKMTARQRALDQVLEFVGKCLTPDVARKIVALRASPRLERRLKRLSEKNAANTLSCREKTEYDSYVEALDVMAILQQNARRAIRQPRRRSSPLHELKAASGKVEFELVPE